MLQKLVLEFGLFLGDVCEVLRCCLFGEKLARYEIQIFGLQSSKMEVLWAILVFDSKNDFEC